MRIVSARRQFIADHSSTNYLFYAAKPLSKEARAFVSTLSSHVDVEKQTARITYNSEFADLGEERRKFLQHYDVEVREDYDWWTLSLMLEKAKLPDIDLAGYLAQGESSLLLEDQGTRLRLRLEGVHLDYQSTYGEWGEDLMEGMVQTGVALRDELYAGQLDALAVLREYCETGMILPAARKSVTPVGETLRSILEPL